MKGKKAAPKSECVKVAIRVRPMNKHEKEQNSTVCVDVDTQNNTVSVSKTDTKTFQFDYVYPMETTQREVSLTTKKDKQCLWKVIGGIIFSSEKEQNEPSHKSDTDSDL